MLITQGQCRPRLAISRRTEQANSCFNFSASIVNTSIQSRHGGGEILLTSCSAAASGAVMMRPQPCRLAAFTPTPAAGARAGCASRGGAV